MGVARIASPPTLDVGTDFYVSPSGRAVLVMQRGVAACLEVGTWALRWQVPGRFHSATWLADQELVVFVTWSGHTKTLCARTGAVVRDDFGEAEFLGVVDAGGGTFLRKLYDDLQLWDARSGSCVASWSGVDGEPEVPAAAGRVLFRKPSPTSARGWELRASPAFDRAARTFSVEASAAIPCRDEAVIAWAVSTKPRGGRRQHWLRLTDHEGRDVGELSCGTHRPSTVSWAADGRHLALRLGNRVCVLDRASGDTVVACTREQPTKVAFAGTYLLVSCAPASGFLRFGSGATSDGDASVMRFDATSRRLEDVRADGLDRDDAAFMDRLLDGALGSSEVITAFQRTAAFERLLDADGVVGAIEALGFAPDALAAAYRTLDLHPLADAVASLLACWRDGGFDGSDDDEAEWEALEVARLRALHDAGLSSAPARRLQVARELRESGLTDRHPG